MTFWLTLVAYQVVWFVTVICAGRGWAWPGALATSLFALWRLSVSPHRRVELRLIGISLALGLLADALLVWTHVVGYAAPWPSPESPLWLTALWAAFALTIVPLFGYLHTRPGLAAAVGAIGGPLAYLAAARGWQAVQFHPPQGRALFAIAIEWGVALPCLCALAHRWLAETASGPASGIP